MNERPATIVITDPRTDRYNSFSFITWWLPHIVHNSRVAVLGAGAVGNEVIKNLALMGIGNLFIADFDTIERNNLSRSILFREADEGKEKSKVAAQQASAINPDVSAQWFHGDVIHDLGLGVYRRMDVIICCLDSREARLSVNRACWKTGRPWVDAGLNGLYSETRVFIPGSGACYECTLSEQDYLLMEERASCKNLAIEAFTVGRIPTTPTAASIAGAVQAQEALKILHNLRVKSGRTLIFDGLNSDAGWYSLTERENCPSHWRYDHVIEIKEASAEKTTVREFFDLIKPRLGKEIILELDFDFVTSWRCEVCGDEEFVMKPIYKLTYEQSIHCGKERQLKKIFELMGNELYADLTLKDFGVPPLHILRLNIGGDYKYCELTGDYNKFQIANRNDRF